jgi:hypothetical protein
VQIGTEIMEASEVDVQIGFLHAAIVNTQKVIDSLESRVPMTMLLQALLVGGVVTLLRDIGSIWLHHGQGLRLTLAVLLALAAISFLASVGAFLASLVPPTGITPGVPTKELDIPGDADPSLFFPVGRTRVVLRLSKRPVQFEMGLMSPKASREFSWGGSYRFPLESWGFPDYPALSARHASLSADKVRQVLTAELLVISIFRAYKSRWARIGFLALVVEIALIAVFLAVLGAAYAWPS